MDQQALFQLGPTPDDGGRNVEGGPAVDATFATSTRIHLDETSWVDHVHGWLTGSDQLVRPLIDEAPWEQRSRWMFTRMVTEPRLTAEYPVIADAPGPDLQRITGALSQRYERPFTRLWMNWYRDHRDGTGWHADRPADQHDEAIIPVLTLGATRKFLIRPTGGGPSRSFVVQDGDLIVMGGRCQKDYQHMVPKQTRPAGGRLSLNFSIDLWSSRAPHTS